MGGSTAVQSLVPWIWFWIDQQGSRYPMYSSVLLEETNTS